MTRISLVVATAVMALVAAGCGSSSSSTATSAPPATSSATATSTAAPASSSSAAPAASSGSISESADPGGALKFTSDSLTAKAGKVTVSFTNKAPESHNFTVATASGSVVGATPTFTGGTKTLSLHLKPGTYTFYCSVPGHEAAGMKGTLTVK